MVFVVFLENCPLPRPELYDPRSSRETPEQGFWVRGRRRSLTWDSEPFHVWIVAP